MRTVRSWRDIPAHVLYVFNNAGEYRDKSVVEWGEGCTVINKNDKHILAIDEQTIVLEERGREYSHLKATWVTTNHTFRLICSLVYKYGTATIEFAYQEDAETILNAIKQRLAAAAAANTIVLPQPPVPIAFIQLQQPPVIPVQKLPQADPPVPSKPAAMPIPSVPQPMPRTIAPVEAVVPPPPRITQQPSFQSRIPRQEGTSSVWKSGSQIRQPAEQFVLTVRRLRLPTSIQSAKPVLIVNLVRLYVQRTVRLKVQRHSDNSTNYDPADRNFSIQMPRSEMNSLDTLQISVYSEERVRGVQPICVRAYPLRELLDAAKLGKVYYLALEGKGNYQMQYNQGKISEKAENLHYAKQYPYELEFSVFITQKGESVSTASEFEVQRQIRIQETQLRANKPNRILIPNRYDIPYDIGCVGYDELLKYRQIIMPNKPKSLEIDCTVEDVIREFEVEQCRSDMSSSLMAGFYKTDRLRLAQRGFEKSERLGMYMHRLNVEEQYAHLSAHKPGVSGQNIAMLSRNPDHPLDSADLQNFLDDYSEYGNRSPLLQLMMKTYLGLKEALFQEKLFYYKQLIPIADRLLKLVEYDAAKRGENETAVLTQAIKLLVVFLKQVLPYSRKSVARLCSDLLHVRILVKQRMREFHFLLNQEQIALDALVAETLLSLFSKQHPQLTYRIWDFLVSAQPVPSAPNSLVLPVLAITYLGFLESNRLTSFIPINQFMLALVDNLNSILPCQHLLQHLGDDIGRSLAESNSRDSKVSKIAKIKYVKRFLKCSSPTISLPPESTGKRSTNPITPAAAFPEPQSRNTSTYSFDSRPRLTYSTPVKAVHLLLGRLFLGHNMNHQPFSLTVRMQPDSATTATQGCSHRSIYLNFYAQSGPTTRVVISVENSSIELYGQLDLLKGYHKDTVYHCNVPLSIRKLNLGNSRSDAIKNDVADSLVECTFVLQSERLRQVTEPYIRYEQVLAKQLTDYDLGNQNSLVKAYRELQEHVQSMKHPLDEFGKPYEAAKICGVNFSESEWIMNSQMSMEQIKTAFELAFLSSDDKEYRPLWSTVFQDFSVGKKCSSFEFGRFIVSLVMSSKASRREKLSCLFKMAAAYQNLPSSQGLSLESLQALLKEMYLRCQYTNPQPNYTKQTGRVLSAFLEYRSKPSLRGSASTQSMMPIVAPVNIEKKDITSLMRTWQHMAVILFGTSDLVLGDGGDQKGLTLLKALFDSQTHSQIVSHGGCRISITYQVAEDSKEVRRFSWVADLDEKFKVRHLGQSTLNQYPLINPLNDMRSEAELLYNSQHTLPLSGKRLFRREEFNQVVMADSVLNYLMCCSIDPTTRLEEEYLKQPLFEIVVHICGLEQLRLSSEKDLLSFGKEGSLASMRQRIRKQLRNEALAGCQFEKWAIEGTIITGDQHITFGSLIKLVRQSSAERVELHYRKKERKTPLFEFYAVRRSSSFQEQWRRCHVLSRNDPFVLVKFLQDPSDGYLEINEYLVPKYEIRGPGFLPAELFYPLLRAPLQP